ncbi:MAG: hypothetical protein NTX64_07950, partial [Elusimicrobia bacterium]|nr:hypothetical protein [Elusimicrobiota bacterium]
MRARRRSYSAADRLKELGVGCIQISLDGPSAAVHEAVRPGGDFSGAVEAVKRLAKRGLEPEVVFVPTRHNLNAACEVFDLAGDIGARAFVTGPMMHLGRAAEAWPALAPSAEEWEDCAARLERLARSRPALKLSVYPWDIVEEVRVRRE